MKVIVAGSSKTGTKTMNAALTELGLKVHDAMEHYTHHKETWLKICTKGGNLEDFKKMYHGVDAVADLPVWYFWEELLEANPEAKVNKRQNFNESKMYVVCVMINDVYQVFSL